MSQDNDHDSSMTQQVKDLVQGAIKELQLSLLMEQLAPLVSRFQAQQESGGGKSSNISPLWG